MCINAFNILDDNLNTIGTGIYLAASVLNHSCVPNATAIFDGTTLRISAIMDIDHSDPELVINNNYYDYDIVNVQFILYFSMYLYHTWNLCKLLKNVKVNYKVTIIFYVNANAV